MSGDTARDSTESFFDDRNNVFSLLLRILNFVVVFTCSSSVSESPTVLDLPEIKCFRMHTLSVKKKSAKSD